MAKGRVISVKLPPLIVRNKSEWRKAIHAAVKETNVTYPPRTELEVAVLFYLNKGKGLITRDVDNLVKHVLDALQARYRETRGDDAFIANDNCIQRVVVEKRARPKNLDETYGGKLEIRPYIKGLWP
jgi:Holliday junction resolvase RusA-like endonuclease